MKKIIISLLKVVMASVLISFLMMLLLAFIMLKTDVSEEMQRIFIVLIYIVSTFAGGLIMGKVMGTKKYLWGMGCGLLYFAIIFVLALVVKNGENIAVTGPLVCFVSCVAGGTIGGMSG